MVAHPETGDLPVGCAPALYEYFDAAEGWLRTYEALAQFILRKRRELAAVVATSNADAAPVLVVDKVRSPVDVAAMTA